MQIAEEIRKSVERTLVEAGLPGVDFVVEHPATLGHGDYASNVALVAARRVGKAPRTVAEQLLAGLEKYKPASIEKIDIAEVGFINFHLSREFFVESVWKVLEQGEGWGRNETLAGKRIIVEYTDPNPFKLFHIGHLMPNALGESLARLCMFSGAEVKRVTYQGDVGIHVARVIWTMKKHSVTPETEFSAEDLGRWYAEGTKDSDESPEVAAEIAELNEIIYKRSDPAVNALWDKGKEVSLREFEKVYAVLGSVFDHNFFESETGPVGAASVRAHPGIFETSDGAVVFRGEEHGLHTRVFVNAKGLPTYEAKDLGLMELKQRWWPFDLTITITGSEQEQYFAVMMKAAGLINPALADKMRVVFNGMLLLPTGKMSSRTGTIVPALSLIEDVEGKVAARMEMTERNLARDIAVGAVKYAILRAAAGKDIVFDTERSISLEGDSGPYVQYTHARICSVLRKASAAGLRPAAADSASVEVAPPERLLYRFPEVVLRAQEEYEPHYVTTFLTELAGAFNAWYAQEQIVDEQDPHSPYKVALAAAVAQTLKNGLWLLGIKAPERM